MKVSREVKTGILAVVAIALVIYGYNFMRGQNIFDSNRNFYAVYDNVDGLSSSADVTINGLKVGSVSKIGFLDKKGKILVEFNVNNNFQFSNTSKAVIYSNGLIGGKAIKIDPRYEGRMAKSGDTLTSTTELELMESLSQRVEPLEQKIESAITGIDSLVQGLNQVIDEDGKQNLKEALAHLNVTMAHLNHTTGEIDKVLSKNADKLDRMIVNLDHTTQNFSNFSDSLAQIEVKPLLHKVDGILADFNRVSAKLSAGEGTMGKLFDDESVYDNLDAATRELEELIRDIKLHPGRYVNLKFSIFGGKNKDIPYQEVKD